MNLNYKTVAEPSIASKKWQHHFHTYWHGYKVWLQNNEFGKKTTLIQSTTALKKYMPKIWDTYVHLCSLLNTDDNELAEQFLTGYCPPAYVSACAQAVIKADKIQLVRNYDYHPDLFEGTLLLSKWNNQKVIATTDCLIGIIDGMNDAGLCVSLTFGGRKEVGIGFGIPFILRYVLEFCTTTNEAVKVLKSIPSHMSYNVTVVDKTGKIKTVMLAPDKAPIVTNDAYATNHQEKIDWHENAQFNQTLKRSNFIKNYLQTKNVSAAELAKAFLHPPLYNTQFKEGFGTLYTAVYQPENLIVQIKWPEMAIERSFDFFKEENLFIKYNQTNNAINTNYKIDNNNISINTYNWQNAVVDSLANAIVGKKSKEKQKELKKQLMPDGNISWDLLVNYWNESLSK